MNHPAKRDRSRLQTCSNEAVLMLLIIKLCGFARDLFKNFKKMDYLQNIIKHKREEIAVAKRVRPLEKIKDGLETKNGLSLKKCILKTTPAIIAEIKRRSPSKGALRTISNPAEIAGMYASAGAAAISVLTDNRYFGGSLKDLRKIKQRVAVPVLRKDFIIDPYQVYESKYYGADVILLITSCLEKNQLSELLYLSKSIGMETLVEIENEKDIAKLEGIEVEIVGVNNRNLHTFEQSIDISFRLYDSLPPASVKISESGLTNAGQLAALFKTGYRGFLIGETLMRTANPEEALSTLINEFNKIVHEKNFR